MKDFKEYLSVINESKVSYNESYLEKIPSLLKDKSEPLDELEEFIQIQLAEQKDVKILNNFAGTLGSIGRQMLFWGQEVLDKVGEIKGQEPKEINRN